MYASTALPTISLVQGPLSAQRANHVHQDLEEGVRQYLHCHAYHVSLASSLLADRYLARHAPPFVLWGLGCSKTALPQPIGHALRVFQDPTTRLVAPCRVPPAPHVNQERWSWCSVTRLRMPHAPRARLVPTPTPATLQRAHPALPTPTPTLQEPHPAQPVHP
jgi:hypothetical protein